MPSLTLRIAACVLIVTALIAAPASAQQRPAFDEELKRIYERQEYSAKTFGPAAWLEEGRRYTTVEPSAAVSGARDIVAYDTTTARREVLVSASVLKPGDGAAPLSIDGYAWSKDRSRLLLFTNSKKVWRDNTRGDYWVLELASGKLRKLGGAKSAPSTLMFAKFSPNGSRVAYVRENNVYVEDVASGSIIQLTKDGSETTINGTSDWVYEEELDLRDCFRWSPDGTKIAYWQFDSSGIEMFTLINDTESLYPAVTRFPYPKVGTVNSAVRIGVVSSSGGRTRWMDVPDDPRNIYLARMDWLSDSATLAIQRLNRLQNTNDLLFADSRTGNVRSVHRDQSKTWVEVNNLEWVNDDEFLWTSEKDGWRHVYRSRKDGTSESLITRFDGDILRTVAIDRTHGSLYFTASPEAATDRYLYRSKLDGSAGVERVTPSNQRGTHSYNISPDGQWAFHTYSRFDMPPVVDLISLPDHRSVRSLVDNAELRAKVGQLIKPPVEFFKIDIGEGVLLDGWMIKPANFDPGRKYPLVVYVYGEVASQTVLDAWGGSRALFHRALANEGYIIVSVDNRGTPGPKGVAWRKIVYGTIGDLSSKDQAAAVGAMAARYPFIDRTRVGIYGHSGGGSNTLNAMFRFPDTYKAGVSSAPVADQKLYDTIYQERYMGLPKDNSEGYRIGSPINFAEGLKGKLLLVHGSGDDNVHYQNTERLVNRLVQLGKRFDLMVYPNRTHALSEGPGTSLHFYSLIARYFFEHL
jgi:dipeptidyl-peptidase-4